MITKSNHKLPRLTKEEFEFFRWKDISLWKKYNVNWIMQRKIASALQELAVKKLLGFGGFERNKSEVTKHHLKACKYNPCIAYQSPNFRKEVGLVKITKI